MLKDEECLKYPPSSFLIYYRRLTVTSCLVYYSWLHRATQEKGVLEECGNRQKCTKTSRRFLISVTGVISHRSTGFWHLQKYSSQPMKFISSYWFTILVPTYGYYLEFLTPALEFLTLATGRWLFRPSVSCPQCVFICKLHQKYLDQISSFIITIFDIYNFSFCFKVHCEKFKTCPCLRVVLYWTILV